MHFAALVASPPDVANHDQIKPQAVIALRTNKPTVARRRQAPSGEVGDTLAHLIFEFFRFGSQRAAVMRSLRLPANRNYQREADSAWRPNDALFPFSSNQTVTPIAPVLRSPHRAPLGYQSLSKMQTLGIQFALQTFLSSEYLTTPRHPCQAPHSYKLWPGRRLSGTHTV